MFSKLEIFSKLKLEKYLVRLPAKGGALWKMELGWLRRFDDV